ncbi:hypothetical protein [Ensifer adhaerens]|uniref:hypothetical protein n=1 Tax=Ensifer adhaerens TaxID=106592 RepID=UPI00131A0207|nr:hypothetical protein [Ensifer adhaerens]
MAHARDRFDDVIHDKSPAHFIGSLQSRFSDEHPCRSGSRRRSLLGEIAAETFSHQDTPPNAADMIRALRIILDSKEEAAR